MVFKSNWPSGVKKTKQRMCVLAVLENADEPLSASEICARIEKSGEAAWLSTVYRVLELFVEKGVTLKTSLMNNEMAFYELNRYQHRHYAVCTECNKIVAMDNCPMEEFTPKIDDADFRVMGHNLEVYGVCRDCNAKKV